MSEVKFQPFAGQNHRDFEIPETAWDSFINFRNKINRFSLCVVVAVFLLVGGIFGMRLCWVGVLTLSSVCYLLYLYARSVANSLYVERRSSRRGKDGEFTDIEYTVTNLSQFDAFGFYIVDPFAGTKSGQIYFEDCERLPALRRRKIKTKIKCDVGMGVFDFGPVWLVTSDPLGIFTFVIENKIRDSIEIFPNVKELPDIRLTGTKYSDTFGIYDQLNVGTSTSFMGIRPYVLGDPMKYISWKISAKVQELVVKVFDRSVSDDVSIVLDFSPAIHMGARGESTWQYMKELALGLSRQCIDHGNRVQIISQNLFLPWGRGKDHWADVTLRLGLHTPEFLKDKSEPGRKLEDYLEIMPNGSTVFFVTNFVLELNEATQDVLEKYRSRSIDVFVFLIDAVTFLKGTLPITMWGHLSANTGARERQLSLAKIKLSSLGIPTYVISLGKDIGTSILEAQAK